MNCDGVVLDAEAIQRTIPHRAPFLLVDRIIELVPQERAVGVHDVTTRDPWLAGHFPARPLMPGVLIVEALAQTAAILMVYNQDVAAGRLPFIAGIDRARFRRPVVIGDELRLEVTILHRRSDSCKLQGIARVGSDVAAQAEILAVLAPAD
ncbi:MAG: 3-hydroxyacyl-ACP dehydratase FabZ [bacterium]|nr:3-hydroxyacyl-ACP dehydratase FabZ [bacterium]